MNRSEAARRSIPWVRWICAIASLGLLAVAIHLLSGGTTGDPGRDSPWPYLALGALLAIRALTQRNPRGDGHP